MALNSILAYFQSFVAGNRLIDGGDLLALAKFEFQATTGITALAGGGQTGATPLNYGINRVDTVATNADSVMLPPAIAGAQVTVYNNSANTLQVFGQPANAGGAVLGDTIAPNNSNTQQATGTGVSQNTAVVGEYFCFINGQWKQLLSA